MIAHLRGKLLAKHPNQAIVETGGVGYDVTISVPTFSDLPGVGGEVALHIHTHVREDALALYGFLRSGEKALFEKLITVSGIGPKLAITILSGMAADEMVNAIRGNDIARLTRIPGIGKKTAERMVLELRDKLAVEKAWRDCRRARPERGRRKTCSRRWSISGISAPQRRKHWRRSPRTGQFDAMFRQALAALSK